MAGNQAIAKVQTQDKDINQLQQNVSQTVAPIANNPITNGNMVSQKLQAGSNVINHGLSRMPKGWIPVLQSANGALYNTTVTAQNITIVSSVAADVSFYFF